MFISHSSQDEAFAGRLVRLLRSALNLPAQAIRATSVEGYGLRGGANVDEQLRREVLESAAFVGVISLGSLKSLYVLFELGARWGAGKPLIPLLAPGVSAEVMGRPLSTLNPLSADSTSEMHQLISELSEHLRARVEPVGVFEADLRVLATGSVSPAGAASSGPSVPEPDISREAGAILVLLSKADGLAAPQLASHLRVAVLKAEQLAEQLREAQLVSASGEPGAPANYCITLLGRRYLVERSLL